jgi:hypothetical protein
MHPSGGEGIMSDKYLPRAEAIAQRFQDAWWAVPLAKAIAALCNEVTAERDERAAKIASEHGLKKRIKKLIAEWHENERIYAWPSDTDMGEDLAALCEEVAAERDKLLDALSTAGVNYGLNLPNIVVLTFEGGEKGKAKAEKLHDLLIAAICARQP